jgi:hypothetical protein
VADSDTYGAVTRAARMLARKTRSQVRVPPPSTAMWHQVTVQSVNTSNKTASVLKANSANPFDAAYSPHYVPAVNDTAWLVMIGTSPLLMAKCQ